MTSSVMLQTMRLEVRNTGGTGSFQLVGPGMHEPVELSQVSPTNCSAVLPTQSIYNVQTVPPCHAGRFSMC